MKDLIKWEIFIFSIKVRIIKLNGGKRIKTAKMLMDEYSKYASPKNKIQRLVEKNEIFPIIKGLYTTDKHMDGCYLASWIYGPSYLSFDYALAYHGLILEICYAYTSATYMKGKSKRYETSFGLYKYSDIPAEAFPYGIKFVRDEKHCFCIASKEKALCDKLYTLMPIKNVDELKLVLLEDLRVPNYMLYELNKKDISFLATKYHCRNVKLLDELLRRDYVK